MYAFIQSTTSFNGIIPDITLTETESNPALITEWPIMGTIGSTPGNNISDNMYVRPKEFIIRAAWSDSTHALEGYSQEVYAALQQLQASMQLFVVTTAKNIYQNCQITGMIVETDPTSFFLLSITISVKSVNLTSNSGGGSLGTLPGGSLQSSQQADASQTSATNPIGVVFPIIQNPSTLGADAYSQIGGISNNTSPPIGGIPGTGFGGTVGVSTQIPSPF